MIETSQLQTLVAVSNAKSFSKAAEDLNVTQSAISQSIKNLETKLDLKLFKRTGKNIVLTPEGEKLYELASHFLEEMRETLSDLEANKVEMRGKVRIGTLTGIGKTWLAKEILDWAHENPDLILTLKMGSETDLIQRFENNLIDILILPEDDRIIHGERIPYIEEKATLVFPLNNPFGITEKTTIEELSKMPTILFENEDHLYYKYFRNRFKKIPTKVNVRFVINSHGHMLQAVQEGLGIAVIPDHVLNRSYFKEKVGTLGVNHDVFSGRLSIVYHKEAEDLKRIKLTLERLLQHGAEVTKSR